MDNNVYLNQIKPLYESLKYFDIKNNCLILSAKQTFIIPLLHTNLSTINKDVFLSSPSEIFHFIQMNELLYKNELTEKELNYIRDFTNRYLKLKNDYSEGLEINNNTLWCFELLISKSFEESFINNPASKEICSVIDNSNKQLESGLGTSMRLVLVKDGNNNFETVEEINNIKNFEKAGFTTLFLIASSVILTCLFIAFFIIGN